MSPHGLWLIGCCLLLAPTQPMQAANMIRLTGMDGRTEAVAAMPAVFGDRVARLDLEIKTTAAMTGSLRADLFQVAGSLAMPVAKDIHLQDALSLPDASPQPIRVSLKFPDVKQRAEILVRFSLAPNGLQSQSVPLGDLRFQVFPANLTKELARLLAVGKSGVPPAVLFGEGHKLRDFFKSVPIRFEDGGSGMPDQLDATRLYLAEPTDHNQAQQIVDRRAGIRLAIFAPDEVMPPGVFAEQKPSATFIRVTLPLLDNLKDDPRAQLELTTILRLLSAPSSSTK